VGRPTWPLIIKELLLRHASQLLKELRSRLFDLLRSTKADDPLHLFLITLLHFANLPKQINPAINHLEVLLALILVVDCSSRGNSRRYLYCFLMPL
jgi:hypothetical protein